MRNRVAKFKVTAWAMKRLLCPGSPVYDTDGRVKVLAGGFPQDMEVIHCEWDFHTQSAVLTATSNDFPIAVEGQLTPWLDQMPSFTEEWLPVVSDAV